MVNPNHITPYGEIPEEERELADDLVFNRREDALERFIAHFESKGAEDEAEAADPTAGMEPEEALHWHILRRKKDGVEAQIDASVEKIGAVPTLNDVLLPAMKEVGDKFGAGELILPFVLQSAEVMKRAVAQLENYLDKLEGYTKGTVVLATVFGDVHDIGKSLVNTILTNNGYTVVDLGKQVPIGTILDAAKEHDATAIGLSRAARVDVQADAARASRSCTTQGLEYPVLIGGAAINRKFGLRALYPDGKESDDDLRARRLLLQGRVRGPRRDGPARRAATRASSWSSKIREDAAELREKGEERGGARHHRRLRAQRRPRTDVPVPEPPFWGVREIEVDLDEVYPHLDTHVLFKLHWGGRGVKGEEWQRAASTRTSARAWSACGASQTYLHPRALLGYFPCYSRGQRHRRARPRGPRDRARAALTARASPRATASAWPTSSGPKDSGELDVVALQAVTVGDEVTELMAQLETGRRVRRAAVRPRPRRADRRGPGRVAALARPRATSASTATQGRRYSWGYPAVPDQSEHDKVDRCSASSRSACSITDGYAPMPEQSTLAIVAHHPQAVYFGMRNGRLLPDGSPDDVIKGGTRDPSLFGEIADHDPSRRPRRRPPGEDRRLRPRPAAALPARVTGLLEARGDETARQYAWMLGNDPTLTDLGARFALMDEIGPDYRQCW